MDQSFLADNLFVQSQQYFYAIKQYDIYGVLKSESCHSCANLYAVNELNIFVF